MATELLAPLVPACYLALATPRIKIKNWRTISATHLMINSSLNREYPFMFRPVSSIKVANQSSGLVDREKVAKIKTELYQAIQGRQELRFLGELCSKTNFQGINRGIFGLPSAKKSQIEDLVKLLESQNPTPEPTKKLETVDGSWKLVYSTISILGSMRTKLGLRDFVSLGDFFQTIDVKEEKAINVIKFSVRGLKMLTGELTIVASFKIASNSRVDIKLENSTIEPDQLMNIFRKNYESLLAIFNPEGWLEISYVDESLRIGRDGKGNIFVLERSG